MYNKHATPSSEQDQQNNHVNQFTRHEQDQQNNHVNQFTRHGRGGGIPLLSGIKTVNLSRCAPHQHTVREVERARVQTHLALCGVDRTWLCWNVHLEGSL